MAADVGGSTVHAAVVADGRVVAEPVGDRSPADSDPAGVVEAFTAVFAAAAAAAGTMPQRVSVAICGPCDMADGTFRRPAGKFSRCTGVPLVPMLVDRLGVAVEFHHDVVAHGVGAVAADDDEVLAVIAGTGASVVVASPGRCDPTRPDSPGVGPDGLSVTRFGPDRLAGWAGTDPQGTPWWAPRAALEQRWFDAKRASSSVREICSASRAGDELACQLVDDLVDAWMVVLGRALETHPVDTVVFGGGVAEGVGLADAAADRFGVAVRYAGPDAALVGAAALAAA